MPMFPFPALRPRRRPFAAAGSVFVGLLVVVLSGCGTPTPNQAELTDALISSGISRPVAECTSKALVDSLSSSELQELAERGNGGAPVDDPKVSGESADKLTEAMTACQTLMQESQTTTTLAGEGGGTITSTPEGSGSDPATDGAELNPASTTTAVP